MQVLVSRARVGMTALLIEMEMGSSDQRLILSKSILEVSRPRARERMRHRKEEIFKQTNKQTNKHTYIHTYVRTYVRTYIHTYIHTYMQTYTYTDRQTDRQTVLACSEVRTQTRHVLRPSRSASAAKSVLLGNIAETCSDK